MNNIREISNNIFTKSCKSPQSIQLHLPDGNNDEIFSILLEIFQNGMMKFHGNEGKVDMDLITEDDFLNIRKYFWSFGFEIFYKIYDSNDNFLKKNKNYKTNTELFNKYLTLTTDTLKYEISFDYYKI